MLRINLNLFFKTQVNPKKWNNYNFQFLHRIRAMAATPRNNKNSVYNLYCKNLFQYKWIELNVKLNYSNSNHWKTLSKDFLSPSMRHKYLNCGLKGVRFPIIYFYFSHYLGTFYIVDGYFTHGLFALLSFMLISMQNSKSLKS